MKLPRRTLFARVCSLGSCACIVCGCTAGLGPKHAAFQTSLHQGQTLDVQVVRKGTRLVFTNTTARSLGPCTLWVNRRFALPLAGLAPGQTVDVSLRDFTDENGERFRGGGFFAAEAPERVVLAQIESTAPDGKPELLGLVVVQGEY